MQQEKKKLLRTGWCFFFFLNHHVCYFNFLKHKEQKHKKPLWQKTISARSSVVPVFNQLSSVQRVRTSHGSELRLSSDEELAGNSISHINWILGSRQRGTLFQSPARRGCRHTTWANDVKKDGGSRGDKKERPRWRMCLGNPMTLQTCETNLDPELFYNQWKEFSFFFKEKKFFSKNLHFVTT